MATYTKKEVTKKLEEQRISAMQGIEDILPSLIKRYKRRYEIGTFMLAALIGLSSGVVGNAIHAEFYKNGYGGVTYKFIILFYIILILIMFSPFIIEEYNIKKKIKADEKRYQKLLLSLEYLKYLEKYIK